jgi:hypothetical protein
MDKAGRRGLWGMMISRQRVKQLRAIKHYIINLEALATDSGKVIADRLRTRHRDLLVAQYGLLL